MNQILTIALPKIIQKNIKQFNTLNQQKLHEKKRYFPSRNRHGAAARHCNGVT